MRLRKKLPLIIAISTTFISPFLITPFVVSCSESKPNSSNEPTPPIVPDKPPIPPVQPEPTPQPSEVKYTFNIKKSTGRHFTNYDPVLNIYQGSQLIIKGLKDWTNGSTDGIIETTLPSGDLRVQVSLMHGNIDVSDQYSFPREITINQNQPNVNINFKPILKNQSPTKTYIVDEPIYNYEFLDVLNKPVSIANNVKNKKATIFVFFKTTCPYSRATLMSIYKALFSPSNPNAAKYKDKVQVLCFSNDDSKDALINFSNEQFPEFSYFTDWDDTFRRQFFEFYDSYPGLAFVDYEGAVSSFTQEEQTQSAIDTHASKIIYEGSLEPSRQEYPTTLDELRETDPKWLATQDKYDSRDFGIIKQKLEPQGDSQLCWSYSTAAASEAAILREGLGNDTKETINLDEDNIDYLSNVRTSEADPLGLTSEDTFNYQLDEGNLIVVPGQALLQWNGPEDYVQGNNHHQYYRNSKYVLESFEQIPNNQKAIKEAVAKHGAVAFQYQFPNSDVDSQYIYSPNGNPGVSHASAIVGWDDTIDKSLFRDTYGNHPQNNGAWIVRNSYSENAHGEGKGYFYFSYDSTSMYNPTSFNYAARSEYQNNYYYDGMVSRQSIGSSYPKSYGKDVAVIFEPLKASYNKKEFLSAINFAVIGNNNTVNVKVYQNVQDNNPSSGTPVAEATETYENQGAYTIQLKEPIELKRNEKFSIVINVTNPDRKGSIAFSDESSTNDLSYIKETSGWQNTRVKQAVARIKAFTTELEVEGEKPKNDLSYAKVTFDVNSWRYGTKNKPTMEVRLEDTLLVENQDYQVTYQNKFDEFNNNNDDVIIGSTAITVNGIGKYQGTKKAQLAIQIGLLELPEGFVMNPMDGAAHIIVDRNITHYNQIQLPEGWVWTYPDDAIGEGKGNYIDYRKEDHKYYRKTMFRVIVDRR